MKKINIRESLLQFDKDTSCQYDLTSLYEACNLNDEDKKKLVQYIDAKDIDATNRFLTNKATEHGFMESVSDDVSDDELASFGVEKETLTEDTDADTIEQKIKDKTFDVLLKKYDEEFVNDYCQVKMGEVEGCIQIRVNAEVSYSDLEDLGTELTKVITEFDPRAYFEPECPGRLVAYVRKDQSEDIVDEETFKLWADKFNAVSSRDELFDVYAELIKVSDEINSGTLTAIYELVTDKINEFPELAESLNEDNEPEATIIDDILINNIKDILRTYQYSVPIYDAFGRSKGNKSLPLIYTNKGVTGVTIKACYPNKHYRDNDIKSISNELQELTNNSSNVSFKVEDNSWIQGLNCDGYIIRVIISNGKEPNFRKGSPSDINSMKRKIERIKKKTIDSLLWKLIDSAEEPSAKKLESRIGTLEISMYPYSNIITGSIAVRPKRRELSNDEINLIKDSITEELYNIGLFNSIEFTEFDVSENYYGVYYDITIKTNPGINQLRKIPMDKWLSMDSSIEDDVNKIIELENELTQMSKTESLTEDNEPEKYIKLDLEEPEYNYFTVGGVEVPYKSHEEAKAHMKDDYNMENFAEEIRNYLQENDIYSEVYVESDGRLAVHIDDGDWKHEHLYTDRMVSKFFYNKGLLVDTETQVTEEDGSDCYSATHYYELSDLIFSMEIKESLEKIATNSKGDYLVASDSGKGFTAFNKNDVCIGGIDGDDQESAINRFKKGDLDESIKITPDSKMKEIDIEDKSETGDVGHPIKVGLKDPTNKPINENFNNLITLADSCGSNESEINDNCITFTFVNRDSLIAFTEELEDRDIDFETTNDGSVHVCNESLNEDTTTRTVGIYGDEVRGMESVEDIVKYLKGRGLTVSDVEGDMDYGWEMNVTGTPSKLYTAIVHTFNGYNSETVEDFISEYAIDDLDEGIVKDVMNVGKAIGKEIKNSNTYKTHVQSRIDKVKNSDSFKNISKAVKNTDTYKDIKKGVDKAKDYVKYNIQDSDRKATDLSFEIKGKDYRASDLKYTLHGKPLTADEVAQMNAFQRRKVKMTVPKGVKPLPEGVASATHMNWDDDDDFTYDAEMWEDDMGVESNKDFFAEGSHYTWMHRIGEVEHLDFDNWAVWSALNQDTGETEYFVVDEDTEFIDWGPVDTEQEAKEFLQSKVDDYNLDESIDTEVSIDSVIDAFKVNGPRSRQDKTPEAIDTAFNIINIKDSMRPKSYQLDRVDDNIQFTWVTQEPFKLYDLMLFEKELIRSFTEVAKLVGYDKEFVVMYDVTDRDGEDHRADDIIINGSINESLDEAWVMSLSDATKDLNDADKNGFYKVMDNITCDPSKCPLDQLENEVGEIADRYTDGNASPEYEGEDFADEEYSGSKIYNAILKLYGRENELTESISNEDDSKALTYDELLKLALENYNIGGDGVYECWDEEDFNNYVEEFGPITHSKALEIFKTNNELNKERY